MNHPSQQRFDQPPESAVLCEGEASAEQRSFFLCSRFRRRLFVLILLMMPGGKDANNRPPEIPELRASMSASVSSATAQPRPQLPEFSPAQTTGVRSMIQQWFMNRDSLDQNALVSRLRPYLEGMNPAAGAMPIRRESTTEDEGLTAYGFEEGVPVVVIEGGMSIGPLSGKTLYVLPSGRVYELPTTIAQSE